MSAEQLYAICGIEYVVDVIEHSDGRLQVITNWDEEEYHQGFRIDPREA